MGTIANAKVTHYYNCYNGDFIGCLHYNCYNGHFIGCLHYCRVIGRYYPLITGDSRYYQLLAAITRYYLSNGG